jgi:hypothetical protein
LQPAAVAVARARTELLLRAAQAAQPFHIQPAAAALGARPGLPAQQARSQQPLFLGAAAAAAAQAFRPLLERAAPVRRAAVAAAAAVHQTTASTPVPVAQAAQATPASTLGEVTT